MRRTGSRLACAAIAALVVASTRAQAQDPRPLSAPGGGQPPPTKGVEETTRRPYWGGGLARPFVSAVFEGGFFYARPQIALGYGKPHWRWLGIEGQTSMSTSGGSEYGGFHAALPLADFRMGARYVFPVNQSFLVKQDSYTQRDTEFRDGPTSRYLSLEAEVAGALPLFGGSFFGVLSGYWMRGVPSGYYLYEESLHVVMAPPYLWRVRGGYVYGFGLNKALRIGIASELIGNPGRDAYVVRIGPVLGVSLTHHLEALATVLGVIAGPDGLRLRGAEIGQLGLRYKWATGDPYPEFP